MFHTDGVPAAEATEDGGFPAPGKWNAPDIWNGYFGCPYYSRIHKQCQEQMFVQNKRVTELRLFYNQALWGQPDGHLRFDNGKGAHYNGSNL